MQTTDEYRLIVAGGRDFNDAGLMREQLARVQTEAAEHGHHVAVVSGAARGADNLGAGVGRELGLHVYSFPADWDTYGKGAGFRRNEEMAGFSDGLLAFWDGQSRGTAHMIQTMRRLGKPVEVIRY